MKNLTATAKQWADLAPVLGLSNRFPELTEQWLDTRDRIWTAQSAARAARNRYQADLDQARSAFVDALVNDTPPPPIPAPPPDPDWFKLAADALERRYTQTVRAIGDDLIAELHQAHLGLVEQATATTDTARLDTLWQRREALLRLHQSLRVAGLVRSAKLPSAEAELRDFYIWRRPPTREQFPGLPLPLLDGGPDVHPMHKLAAIADQCGPGCYTIDQAIAHRDAWEAEQAAARREARARSRAEERAELIRTIRETHRRQREIEEQARRQRTLVGYR